LVGATQCQIQTKIRPEKLNKMKKSAQNQKIVKISLPSYIAGICFEAEFKMLRAMPFV